LSETLVVKVIPNAKKNAIEGVCDGVLKVRIQAPPDKGKANDELIAFLAKSFNLSKSQIRIVSGQTARLKRLIIEGIIDRNKFI
jgi:uncharacterized protein (TIGR00251 family)